MWTTCYNCNGDGMYVYRKDISFLPEEDIKDKNKGVCHICERYRVTIHGFEFYGHIWIDEDYEIVTPPSSPK